MLVGVGLLLVLIVASVVGVRLAGRMPPFVVALLGMALSTGVTLATLVFAMLLVVLSGALVVFLPAPMAPALAVVVQAFLGACGAALLTLLALLAVVLLPVLALRVVAALL